MDQHIYDNWMKIKETFEKSGNTSNSFYKRACEIVKTKIDPLKNIWEMNEQEEDREFYKQLMERVKQLRMRELFEEPSTYEDYDDDFNFDI